MCLASMQETMYFLRIREEYIYIYIYIYIYMLFFFQLQSLLKQLQRVYYIEFRFKVIKYKNDLIYSKIE